MRRLLQNFSNAARIEDPRRSLCDGGVTHRSRRGTLTGRAVQTAKRRAAEAMLSQVYVVKTWYRTITTSTFVYISFFIIPSLSPILSQGQVVVC